ncbi:hypothetical protein RO3G_15605 [Rhizopus delemar RA 99-880]|uniref:Uncharacterized protein n=1 Tax=Rhizopus delemar (strain RA 99-880 / ATCC MYA-4621 / FGSC 9543 / NRRL 43880) TaxID=246409 RepID=I1CR14_RHIO9|nr:hypothetical protein RO3G_15605 [Rhizopus delemar RA 99-880]|eukprot:EIE90894.1 hypothetical protein RO3G_15605 [Rhizopus delemar RA 99-880]
MTMLETVLGKATVMNSIEIYEDILSTPIEKVFKHDEALHQALYLQKWQGMNPWSQNLSCACQVYVYILRVTLKLGPQLQPSVWIPPTHSLDIQIFIKKSACHTVCALASNEHTKETFNFDSRA